VFRPRELQGSVVVLVGASSGIGRAAALQLAQRGAHLVLVARGRDALDDVTAECRRAGVSATPVAIDYARIGSAEHILEEALRVHGHVDTWIDAGAGLAAGVLGTETPEEVEQLIRTNLVGPALASRVAFAYFRSRGRGVLVNVSSMLGVVPNPLVPVYTATKFGVRGLTSSLRHVPGTGRRVRACVVLPGPVDTPMFERAANHTGRQLRAIPPAIAPERVAAAIVSCVRRPRPQAPVGFTSRVILLGLRIAPRTTERAVARYSAATLLRGKPSDETTGTLFAPGPPARVEGGWRKGSARRRIGNAVGRAFARSV
jgi:short-subunit dehydrogenase